MSHGRPLNNFSFGPPASSTEDSIDSGLLDDNDMTSGLLANNNNNNGDSNNNNNNGNNNDPTDNVDEDNAENMGMDMDTNSEDQRHSKIRLIMRRIGPHVASATLMTMLLLVPLVIYRALSDKKVEMAAFHSAGVMVIGTLVMSIRLIYLHFTHWYMPGVQKYVIRIILMVPIYAVQSWLSLRFHHARIYIDAIRDLYEAFVIASFVYYLIELLGGEEALVRTLRQKVRDDPALAEHLGAHTFPLSIVLEPWELGVDFMLQCKHGALQYVVAKTGFTILTYIFQSLGMYGEGQFDWTSPYPYLAFLMNISVMYALYSLVKLFHAVQDELRYPINWHPLGKFLCIKGVVFFTWWQGVLIFYLKAHGVIGDVGSWTGDEVANGLIDYCICVEMVMFAIAHSFTFTYTEYLPSTVENAIVGYEQGQQQLLPRETIEGNNGNNNNNNNNINNNDDHDHDDDRERSFSDSQGPSYNPPEMLTRPAKFKDAFWSSTVPSETIQDIRRFQNGVNHAASRVINPGIISLQGLRRTSNRSLRTTDNDNGDDDEPDIQQHDV